MSIVYPLLAVAGLSFCFFLGFPFDNHNESYRWIPALAKASMQDVLTKQVINIESFRPLGMAFAWLTVKISDNIYLQQIMNWLFAVSSFLVLYRGSARKPSFAILAFGTGGIFFAGYIYLFHLHGVFYGPFQLYTAGLMLFAFRENNISPKNIAVWAAITAITCLFHTFALLLFCAFIGGYMLQMRMQNSKKVLGWLILALVGALALCYAILHGREIKTVTSLTRGFLVSYSMAEAKPVLSLFAVIPCVLLGISLSHIKNFKQVIAVVICVTALVLLYVHIPVLILWPLLSIIKLAIDKKWSAAAIIGAASILPLGSSSGSPTYVVFVLMLCCYITAAYSFYTVQDTKFIRLAASIVLVCTISCLALIMVNINVPLLSVVARPILAEKEKTKQMTALINWKIKNPTYHAYHLTLFGEADLPVNASNTIDRANRPVTFQSDIDIYMNFVSEKLYHTMPADTANLYITFGDQLLPNKKMVLAVDGKWNGKAYLFR